MDTVYYGALTEQDFGTKTRVSILPVELWKNMRAFSPKKNRIVVKGKKKGQQHVRSLFTPSISRVKASLLHFNNLAFFKRAFLQYD